MALKGSYLRVLTPITSDGISPVTENDKIKYREDHLPLTAKKMLEAKNAKLSPHLRKKIEEVNEYSQPKYTKPQKEVEVEESFEVETVTPKPEAFKQPEKKNKGGRPKKSGL